MQAVHMSYVADTRMCHHFLMGMNYDGDPALILGEK